MGRTILETYNVVRYFQLFFRGTEETVNNADWCRCFILATQNPRAVWQSVTWFPQVVAVVSRIMASPRRLICQFLETEYVTLCGVRCFGDMIRLRILSCRDYTGLSQWGQGHHEGLHERDRTLTWRLWHVSDMTPHVRVREDVTMEEEVGVVQGHEPRNVGSLCRWKREENGSCQNLQKEHSLDGHKIVR